MSVTDAMQIQDYRNLIMSNLVNYSEVEGHNPKTTTPIALISLSGEVTRRRLLLERNIPEVWVNKHWHATDLRHKSATDVASLQNKAVYVKHYGDELRPAQVGCAESHLAAWRWLIASDFAQIIVLEDDIIPFTTDWLRKMENIAVALMPSAQCGAAYFCHFGPRPEQLASSPILRIINASVSIFRIRGRNHLWRAHAYMISREAAQRGLDLQKNGISIQIDDFGHFQDKGAFDSVFVAHPALLRQDEEIESTVQLPKNITLNNATSHQLSIVARIRRKVNELYKGVVRKVSSFPFITWI